MSKIQEKVDALLDELQAAMESNKHLSDAEMVESLISKVSLYWAHMDDEGKDYVHGCRHAIEEGIEWKV